MTRFCRVSRVLLPLLSGLPVPPPLLSGQLALVHAFVGAGGGGARFCRGGPQLATRSYRLWGEVAFAAPGGCRLQDGV
jgi:hypothetical protein